MSINQGIKTSASAWSASLLQSGGQLLESPSQENAKQLLENFRFVKQAAAWTAIIFVTAIAVLVSEIRSLVRWAKSRWQNEVEAETRVYKAVKVVIDWFAYVRSLFEDRFSLDSVITVIRSFIKSNISSLTARG